MLVHRDSRGWNHGGSAPGVAGVAEIQLDVELEASVGRLEKRVAKTAVGSGVVGLFTARCPLKNEMENP